MTATEVPKQGKGVKQAVGLSHGHKARESGGDGNCRHRSTGLAAACSPCYDGCGRPRHCGEDGPRGCRTGAGGCRSGVGWHNRQPTPRDAARRGQRMRCSTSTPSPCPCVRAQHGAAVAATSPSHTGPKPMARATDYVRIECTTAALEPWQTSARGALWWW